MRGFFYGWDEEEREKMRELGGKVAWVRDHVIASCQRFRDLTFSDQFAMVLMM